MLHKNHALLIDKRTTRQHEAERNDDPKTHLTSQRAVPANDSAAETA